jgi:AhpD family alkylhydroperoxidase
MLKLYEKLQKQRRSIMDIRIKELIAIGASVTANCQPCFKYHVDKAKESGADEQEIIEAIDVAKMIRKGAESQMEQLFSTVFTDAG